MIKARRVEKSLDAAQAALASENYQEAARLTGAAWRLGTGEISQARELFRLASQIRSPDAMPLGKELFAHEDADSDDRLAVIEFVSKNGNRLLLDALINQLQTEERNDERVLAVRIRQFLMRGNRIGALRLMDSLPKSDAESEQIRLLRCQLLAGERGNPWLGKIVVRKCPIS